MPIPVLKLSLVPPPNLWRQFHEIIGWIALGAGLVVFAGTGALTWRAYAQAIRAGKETVRASNEAQKLARDQEGLVRNLQSIDVTTDLPRWRLAERYFSERTLRWSRLTAELERALTRDVRLKSIQKVRGSDQQVQLKLRGEGRTREAEATFIESLYANQDVFPQILLDREAERQGGGVDFDLTLAVNPLPPPYQKLSIPPPVYRDQTGKVLDPSHPAVKEWLAAGGAKQARSTPPSVPAAPVAAPVHPKREEPAPMPATPPKQPRPVQPKVEEESPRPPAIRERSERVPRDTPQLNERPFPRPEGGLLEAARNPRDGAPSRRPPR